MGKKLILMAYITNRKELSLMQKQLYVFVRQYCFLSMERIMYCHKNPMK